MSDSSRQTEKTWTEFENLFSQNISSYGTLKLFGVQVPIFPLYLDKTKLDGAVEAIIICKESFIDKIIKEFDIKYHSSEQTKTDVVKSSQLGFEVPEDEGA